MTRTTLIRGTSLPTDLGNLNSQLVTTFAELNRVVNTEIPQAHARNLVVDGAFTLWDFGTSLAASSSRRYLANVWATAGSGGNVTPSQVGTAHRVVVASAGYLEQWVEVPLSGTLTMSATLTGPGAVTFSLVPDSGSTVTSTTFTLSSTPQRHYAVLTLDGAASPAKARINFTAAGTYDVADVLLEVGETYSAFVAGDPAAEGLRAARFVETGAVALTHASGAFQYAVRFTARKRTTPTVTLASQVPAGTITLTPAATHFTASHAIAATATSFTWTADARP